MSRGLQITQTEEWRSIIKQMYEMLAQHQEAVIQAASTGIDVPKKFGIYDGYRQAIEKLLSFGEENHG